MKLPSFLGKNRKEKARQKKWLINAIKGKAVSQIRAGSRERKQLNISVDSRLRGYLKRLAAKYSVPRDIIAEHALEQGIFYMERILENDDLAKKMRQHLIDDHQLRKKIVDNESILRMGEGSNISELLDQVEPVLKSWHQFKRAVTNVQKTENITYLELYEKQLQRAVVNLASWLEKNQLGKL